MTFSIVGCYGSCRSLTRQPIETASVQNCSTEFVIFAKSQQLIEGEIIDGKWVCDGQPFDTPSTAASALARSLFYSQLDF